MRGPREQSPHFDMNEKGYNPSGPFFSLFLRNWDSNAIAGNDLCLIGEDFATLGIDDHSEPVDVICSIGLVVAEGFNACEIFKAAACADGTCCDEPLSDCIINNHLASRFSTGW